MTPQEHDEIRENLALHASGDLEADQMREIDSHLAHCAGCARELESLRRTMQIVRSCFSAVDPEDREPRSVASATRRGGRKAAWVRRAAALLLAFLAGLATERYLVGEPAPPVAGGRPAKRDAVPVRLEEAYRAATREPHGFTRGLLGLSAWFRKER